MEEKVDQSMRLRLAQKYVGMNMRDISDDDVDMPYDDYRIVVDLEWSSNKITGPGYNKKKGWMLVCELISPYHDAAIVAAGDDKTAIREAYVINDSFFACVCAAPKQIQKRQVKTRAQYDDEKRAAVAVGRRVGGGGGGAVVPV